LRYPAKIQKSGVNPVSGWDYYYNEIVHVVQLNGKKRKKEKLKTTNRA